MREYDEDADTFERFASDQGRGAADAANKSKVKRRLKHELKQGKRKHHKNKRGRYEKKRGA